MARRIIAIFTFLFCAPYVWGAAQFFGKGEDFNCGAISAPSTEITMFGVYKATSSTGHRDEVIVGKSLNITGTSPYESYKLNISGDDLFFYFGILVSYGSSAGNFNAIDGATNLSAGITYYVVGTWKSGVEEKLYIFGSDGFFSEQVITANVGTIPYSGARNTYIGYGENAGNYGRTDGTISDVGIYNISLSRSEVISLAQGMIKRTPLTIHPENLVAYWTLDDGPASIAATGSEGTAYDKSGNFRPCTAENNPLWVGEFIPYP